MRSRETVWERPVNYLAGLTLAMLLGWSVCGCGLGYIAIKATNNRLRFDDDGMIILDAFGQPDHPIQRRNRTGDRDEAVGVERAP